MRITTRVAASLFLMAILLMGALAYQLSQVEKLQGISREVSLIKLEAARISVGLLQGLDGVREFAAKSALLGDPDYVVQWEEWEMAVEDDLRRLADVGLSEPEEILRGRIQDGWAEYRSMAPDLVGGSFGLLETVEGLLSDLRADTRDLIRTNEEEVAERAALAADAAERARLVAWIVTGSALLLAGVLSLLLFTSISGPLRRLTRGTRELAEGHFEHRLEVVGPGELRSLGRDFNEMATRLGELEDMKREFVSHVSHELKTPLAAVQETIEILLDEVPGPLTAKQARLLELSRRSSRRLSSMISNLLEISRLESGQGAYRPKWCNLPEIVSSVLEEAEPIAQEGNLRFSLRIEAAKADLVCDRGRIEEVVGNLVGNAMKFSPKGGELRVTVSEPNAHPEVLPPGAPSRLREGGAGVLLTVEDEGPGVPDGHKELIFEKFHQVDRTAQPRNSGVGLGLAIAHRIVEVHDGVIWVNDRPGGGSAFHVLLPRVPSRWRDRALRETPPRPVRQGAPEHRVPAPGPPSAGIGLGAVAILLLLSGCASFSSGGGELPPEASDRTGRAVLASAASSPSPPELELAGPAEVLLAHGWSLLAAGSYESAGRRFRLVAEGDAPDEARVEALWGVTLVHLLPGSPLRDPELAAPALVALEREFGDGVTGLQATLLQSLLEELDRVRSVASDQEEVLRQLAETVELLKRIDLNRRPARDTRPDTLPQRPLLP